MTGALKGKVAIVTGAARGLGRDYAEFLTRDGAAVVLADVNGDIAERSASELVDRGATAIGVTVDVTDYDSATAMFEAIRRDLGGVDILINNAALWGDLEIRFLIRDGAGQFIGAFDEVFRSDGATIIRTPPYTPVANAYAERWVGTVRRELCDRTLIWNRQHLEQLLSGYAELLR